MSVYFSKFMLNTYSASPYFMAQIPEDFPLSLVLQKSRAFRRLPPVLKELAGKAKANTLHDNPSFLKDSGIGEYYDDEGYELDPDTGERLTDEQIDEMWDDDSKLDKYEEKDIPKPPGGFPDPDTWKEESEEEEGTIDRSGVTEDMLKEYIASRGIKATAKEFGVPSKTVEGLKSEEDCIRAILDMNGKSWKSLRKN